MRTSAEEIKRGVSRVGAVLVETEVEEAGENVEVEEGAEVAAVVVIEEEEAVISSARTKIVIPPKRSTKPKILQLKENRWEKPRAQKTSSN